MVENFFKSSTAGVIVVASCESAAESRAVLRWIMPVLEEWPRQAWNVWLLDARDDSKVVAALAPNAEQRLDWVEIDTTDYDGTGAVCQVLSGKTGLVLLLPEIIAEKVVRAVEGLVSEIITLPASDPLAKPFKRSFASFGVFAGI